LIAHIALLAASISALQQPASAPPSLPRAPGARVVDVSPPEARGNEPGIAVNPRNPAQIVGVYQGPAHAVYSTDSGRTFTTATGTVPSDWRSAGDVSVTFDNQGAAYLCYLVFDRLGTTSYWRHGAGRNGVYVRRSPDGGATWDKDPAAVRVWYTGKEPGMQFEDMPRIFADNAPRSPYAGNLYVGWIEWQIDKSIMLFARSTDHGTTWSAPIRVSTQAGFPRDDNGNVVGFHGVVDAEGTIYAVWNWGLTIVMATSRDGGKTFTPSRVVQHVGPPYFGGTGAVPGLGRVFGFPQVGVFGSNLYLAWSDFRNGDIDVFLAASRDRGRTWAAPVRVTTDSLHSGRDQFFQFLAVDPMNGDVYVQFFDRRDDPTNRRTGFTLARSTDGGRSFKNYAWSDSTFEGRNAFLGDYTWLTAYDGRVYGIWAETAMSGPSAPPGGPQAAGTVVRVGTADFRRP
jgi:hypothetical protein